MEKGNFEIQKSHIEPEKLPEEGEKKIEDKLAEAIGKMYEQLQETGKNLREVIPQDRNFDIELQESEDGINLRLRHKESGKEKDLNLFLPPKHFFGKDEIFIYRGGEKKVGFPESEIKFRGFLLSLFHELGHSHEKREHSTTRWDDLRALGGLLKKWFQYVVIAVKKEREQRGSGEKFMNVVKKLDVDSLLPQWYIDKRARSDAQSERDAWAYALRSLRKLKSEGYDVFAGYDSVAQIRAYVAYCLYTYDMDLFMKRLMSGDLKDLQKLRELPAFSKERKMHNRVILPGEDDKERESTEDKS
jgi:hypothetical protein